MATVPELKIIAERIGVKITSKMRKADIESAIAEAERREAESDSKPVTDPTPTDPRAERREAARLAGNRASVTAPMHNLRRAGIYADQTGRALLDPFSSAEPTPAQSRRMRKSFNRTFKAS